MKTIKNKTTEINVTPTGDEKLTFADLAKVCVNNMPQGGLDVSQMKARLDVMEALEKANGEIKLTTSAQTETLKDCVKAMRWAILHKDVVEFTDAVEKLD